MAQDLQQGIGTALTPKTEPFKVATHWLAVGIAAAAAFAISPAGQALVAQYPKLSGLVAVIAAIGALYRTPRQS